MAPELLKELPLLEVEDAEFLFRTNFAGVARPPYDEEGDHYFNLKVPSNEQAEVMARDGWNVKWSKPSKNATPDIIEQHVPEPYIVVAIGFKFRPPTVILIRNGRPVVITEKTIGILDSTEFSKVDLVVRARRHEMQGGGYKAWLAEFYGHVNLSEMGSKYAYLLDSGSSADDETSQD